MMEYANTGVSQFAIGNPTDEEREQLVKEGYTFMSRGVTEYEPHEYYEIWLKRSKGERDENMR